MRNVLKPLAKCVLIQLGLTTAASAIHQNMFGSATTTLIISNEEMDNVIKTIKSFEESGFLIKGVSNTIKNKAKEQKRRFFSILIDTLGASLLRDLLTDKGTVRAGEGTFIASQDF